MTRYWRALGPTCMGVGRDAQVRGGRINALAIDPRDPSGETVLVGSAHGGVFRTTDGGVNWSPLAIELPPLTPLHVRQRVTTSAVGALAFHQPGGGKTYLALGTGDTRRFSDRRAGMGAFISDDGGATWLARPDVASITSVPARADTTIFNKSSVNAVVADTSETLEDGSHRFVAATSNGVFVSRRDGTMGWRRVVKGHWTALAMSDGRLIGARAGRGQEGIYRVGVSRLGSSTLPAAGTYDEVTLAVAPSNDRIVFAAFMKWRPGYSPRVFRSEDGGRTWTKLESPYSGWSAPRGRAGGNRLWIAVHPADANRVYVNDGRSLMHSFDGGKTELGWDDIDDFGVDRQRFAAMALATSPESPFLAWLATTDGVYVSRTEGARTLPAPEPDFEDEPVEQETRWESRNRTLPTVAISGIAQHPKHEGVLVAAVPGQAAPVVFRGHPLWQRVPDRSELLERLQITAVAIDPNAPDDWYATGVQATPRVVRSRDRGKTWKGLTKGLTHSHRTFASAAHQPIAIDPNNRGVVYVGLEHLYRRDDIESNSEWHRLPVHRTTAISAIAVAPSNSTIVWVAFEDGELHRVERRPSGRVATNKARIVGGRITSLLIDNDAPNSGYFSVGAAPSAVRAGARSSAINRLFWFSFDVPTGTISGGPISLELSLEARRQWGVQTLPEDVSVQRVIRHPTQGRRLYIGTDLGVFTSVPFLGASGIRVGCGELRV